jgi:ferredoxin
VPEPAADEDRPMNTFAIHLPGGQGFRCNGGQSVLEGMMARGRSAIAVGCRGGGCGVCKVRVIDGRYRTGIMSAACVTPEEREQGVALACKLFPESDVSLEVLGRIGLVLGRARFGTFDPGLGSRRMPEAPHPSDKEN